MSSIRTTTHKMSVMDIIFDIYHWIFFFYLWLSFSVSISIIYPSMCLLNPQLMYIWIIDKRANCCPNIKNERSQRDTGINQLKWYSAEATHKISFWITGYCHHVNWKWYIFIYPIQFVCSLVAGNTSHQFDANLNWYDMRSNALIQFSIWLNRRRR